MKILLSAYACEPNKGSEPEVGWHWGIELASMGHEVWILTRTNNRINIESEISLSAIPNLHFIYFDLPAWMRWWKQRLKGIYFYYLLWQIGAFFVALYYHRQIRFEQVRHITFVSVRQPSFMGLLGIPFFFGPVAGGERAPYRLRKSYPLHGWLKDAFRDLLNAFLWLDPLMHLTFSTANHITVTSLDTQKLLPAQYRSKSSIQLAIGLSNSIAQPLEHISLDKDETIKILYVGNLLYLKGIHIGLHAFAKFKKICPNSHFTLIGRGADATWLKALASKLEIDKSLTWIDHMPRRELLKEYANHDIFLFPSFHDSGGMVVLEAMAHGLPVICLDLGGPGIIVNDTCGRTVPTRNRTVLEVVNHMASFLQQLAQDQELTIKLKQSALSRAQEFSWTNKIGAASGLIENSQIPPSVGSPF